MVRLFDCVISFVIVCCNCLNAGGGWGVAVGCYGIFVGGLCYLWVVILVQGHAMDACTFALTKKVFLKGVELSVSWLAIGVECPSQGPIGLADGADKGCGFKKCTEGRRVEIGSYGFPGNIVTHFDAIDQ